MVLLVVAVLVSGILILATPDCEPVVEGRTLSQWLALWASPGEPAGKAQAATLIRGMETNGLSFLMRCLDYRQTGITRGFHTTVNRLARALGFEWRSTDELANRAWPAAQALAILSPESREAAVRQLHQWLEATNDHHLVSRAVLGLVHLGPEALPVLASILSNKWSCARPLAAGMLHHMGTNAQPLVPHLLRCLHDPNDARVACGAASSLGILALDASRVVPALVESLSDSRKDVRINAIFALGEYGTNALPTIPALMAMVESMDFLGRSEVTNSLRNIKPEILVTQEAPPP